MHASKSNILYGNAPLINDDRGRADLHFLMHSFFTGFRITTLPLIVGQLTRSQARPLSIHLNG